MSEYLQATPTIDFEHPAVGEFVGRHAGGSTDSREQAVGFFYAVRDGVRYDPYTIDPTIEGLRASTTLATRRGWCVSKAILLAACWRAVGLPARLGFADVRNHLSTARMREQMKTDVFFWHGYASVLLDGLWLRATPAFNIELCERFRLEPLDFDGRSDSLYHPFDIEGNRHMEYIRYRGEFADVPIDRMMRTFRREYPEHPAWNEGDFDREVKQEVGRPANEMEGS